MRPCLIAEQLSSKNSEKHVFGNYSSLKCAILRLSILDIAFEPMKQQWRVNPLYLQTISCHASSFKRHFLRCLWTLTVWN